MTIKRSIAEMLTAKASPLDMVNAGHSVDDIAAALKAQLETSNKEAQAALDYNKPQDDAAWQARKAWLLDGQPIHGESAGLRDFFWPALIALQNDDQVEFSRQRDLLFKALRTFMGDPPPSTDDPVLEAESGPTPMPAQP